MSYTELLDRFWAMDRDFSFAERTLYLFLLHYCSSLDWPDTFSLSNDEICERLGCSQNSIRAARKALVDSKLILLHTGNGKGVSTLYSINPEATPKGSKFEPFSDPKGAKNEPFSTLKGSKFEPFENVCGSKSAEENPEATPKGSNSDNSKEKQNKQEKNIPPAPPIKKKKEKEKENAQSKTLLPHRLKRVRTRVNEDGQSEIVFKDVEKEAKERLNRRPEPPNPHLPASIDEVFTFFERKADGRLPDWKNEAEAFFYHYESYGWNGTSNRKILDWESKANLWICDKILELKKAHNNGTNNTNHDRYDSDREAADLVERLLRENRREG